MSTAVVTDTAASGPAAVAGGAAPPSFLGAGAGDGAAGQAGGGQGGGSQPAGGQPGAGQAGAAGSALPDSLPLGELDDDGKAWLQTKGYKSVADFIRATRSLESTIGREKLPLPKDEQDREGWDRLHKAAGWPEKAEDYGLQLGEAADPQFADAFLKKAHEARLSKRQAQDMVSWWNETSTALREADEQRWATEATQQAQAVLQELGASANGTLELARRGMTQLGLTPEQGRALERTIGMKAAVQLCAEYGRAHAEDRILESREGGPGSGIPRNAENARAKLTTLMSDGEFTNRLANGDPDAKRQQAQLFNVINGQRPGTYERLFGLS